MRVSKAADKRLTKGSARPAEDTADRRKSDSEGFRAIEETSDGAGKAERRDRAAEISAQGFNIIADGVITHYGGAD